MTATKSTRFHSFHFTMLFIGFVLHSLFPLWAAEGGVGMVIFTKGAVSIVDEKGVVRPVTAKMIFKEKEKITTGKGALAVLRLMDKSTIKLEQDSTLDIVELIASYKAGLMGSSNLLLSSGRALIDVVKRYSGPPTLEVNTSKGISFGVRGTSFMVDIDPKTKTVWCSVGSGVVQAFDYDNDDSEIVTKGNSIAISEGKTLTQPIKFQWAEKINWNTDPQKGNMDSLPVEVTTTREEEEKSQEAVIKKRTPKPFKRALERQRKQFEKGVREELPVTAESSIPTPEPGDEVPMTPEEEAKLGHDRRQNRHEEHREDRREQPREERQEVRRPISAQAGTGPGASTTGTTSSTGKTAPLIKKNPPMDSKAEQNGADETNAKKACVKMANAFTCEATKGNCPPSYFLARQLGKWKVCVLKK